MNWLTAAAAALLVVLSASGPPEEEPEYPERDVPSVPGPWFDPALADDHSTITGIEMPTDGKPRGPDLPAWESGPGDVSFEVPVREEPMDPSLAACVSDAERRICLPDFDFGQGPVEEPGEEPTDEEIVDVVFAVVERAWATFRIEPSPVMVQPAGGEVLVGMYTIFYTEPRVQRFSTTMLDRGVVLEVEPVRYEWDFGDGSPVLVTSDPGAPYPGETITHTYGRAGVVAPELTTRWVGRVWIEGIGGWFAVRGQGVTTGQGDPIEAVSRQNRLVPGPVHP